VTAIPHSDVLRVEDEEQVVTVTLHRPERLNALDRELMDGLRALWAALARKPDLRCVIVTGAGRGFCSGADLDLLRDSREDAPASAEAELAFLPGRQLDVPVICAVNGVCAGGGLHFVGDADIAIASERASFLDPHVSVGQVSALEPLALALRMRPDALRRLVLLGGQGRLDAAAARECGLVSEVVPDTELLPRARELARAIAAGSPQAVAESRRVLRDFEEALLRPHFEAGWAAIRRHWGHPDAAEGPRAAVDGREPHWGPREERRRAPPAPIPADELDRLMADDRVWTNVYVQFSLPGAVRRRVDDRLRGEGTTLGREFGKTLRLWLAEVGVDPERALERPARDAGAHAPR
jgi:enoyl-CoA hydratase/carnithine racemase